MTVAGWMLYVVLVGAFLALAAWSVEQGASRFRLPLRWIWVGALYLGVLIPVWNLVGPAPFWPGGEVGHVEGSAWMGPPGPAEAEGIIGAAGPGATGMGRRDHPGREPGPPGSLGCHSPHGSPGHPPGMGVGGSLALPGGTARCRWPPPQTAEPALDSHAAGPG